MNLPWTISIGQIRKYLRCSAQYYSQYIQGIQVPPSGSMVFDGIIIDHKVVSRTPPRNTAADDIQLSAYSLTYWYLCGEMPKGVQLNYLVRNRAPKIVTRSAVLKYYNLFRLTQIVEGVAGAIRAGLFYPNPDNFICSSSSCGYWEICHKEGIG